jgi:chorismate synthase
LRSLADIQRSEYDAVHIQSGTEYGVTLGTPIGLLVHNKDHRPNDYAETDFYPRPSHADYTYLAKYGVKASSGGGRASARETIGRVAAGAIAEKYLKQCFGVEIVAFVSGVGKIGLPFDDGEDIVGKELMKLVKDVTREEIDQELTRCPHKETSQKMTDVSNSCWTAIQFAVQIRLHVTALIIRQSGLPRQQTTLLEEQSPVSSETAP